MVDDQRLAQDPELLRRLLRARDRMVATPQGAWTVPRLARVSGVSPAHFARCFKLAFGAPPHRYLLSLRLERAVGLLRDTELSVTEVAFASGWRSLGTFSRTFREVLGLSPSDYRAMHQPRAAALAGIPTCYLRSSARPHLTTAVLEKRGDEAGG
jgi:transcriptional regulator GlxA family with amidase domain